MRMEKKTETRKTKEIKQRGMTDDDDEDNDGVIDIDLLIY